MPRALRHAEIEIGTGVPRSPKKEHVCAIGGPRVPTAIEPDDRSAHVDCVVRTQTAVDAVCDQEHCGDVGKPSTAHFLLLLSLALGKVRDSVTPTCPL